MKQVALILVSTAFAMVDCNTTVVTQDDKEPSQVMILTIDSKEHVLEENTQTQIVGKLVDAKYSIRNAGNRIFRYAGLSFQYSEDIDFESEHDGDHQTWSLENDNLQLDILFLPGDPSSYLQDSVDKMIPMTDKPNQNAEIKHGKFQVGDREFNTYEYEMMWDDGFSSVTWAIELSEFEGKSRVLTFDRSFENGKLTKACALLEKMVIASLKQ